jgi:hypothetical protein
MKNRSQSLIAVGILFASALWVISQQTNNPTTDRSQPSNASVDSPPFFSVDRRTWNVVDSHNRGVDLSSANTQEQRIERWKAVLSFEFPFEYEKQFPRTLEEMSQSQAAAYAIEHPKTLEQFLAEPRTAEEQRAVEDSLNAILHPQPATTEESSVSQN